MDGCRFNLFNVKIMTYNEQTRLLIADADKWLTMDNQIFVKSMFLAKEVNCEDVREVSDYDKIQSENNQTDTDNESTTL